MQDFAEYKDSNGKLALINRFGKIEFHTYYQHLAMKFIKLSR